MGPWHGCVWGFEVGTSAEFGGEFWDIGGILEVLCFVVWDTLSGRPLEIQAKSQERVSAAKR